MDFSTIDLDALIPKLEDRRVSLNLSYQNVADACNVSQSTIIRIFKRQADPSIVVLRSILAAVKYDIVTPPMPDEGPENEQIEYLKKSIEFEREDKIVRLAQQEAQFMRQHNEDRRLVRICLIICIILVIFVCFFFWLRYRKLRSRLDTGSFRFRRFAQITKSRGYKNVNSTPFVRQYDIMFNRWGDFNAKGSTKQTIYAGVQENGCRNHEKRTSEYPCNDAGIWN
ncbi:MAG: helix-turn-helix domain-containing protein [Hominenteromicrobium sp.]|uniref:helix-turn-helix domain-containing protein n=1 Tax=Hominenteromicrobium sp. TaxID=3073581 RepID=UPI0039A28237